MVFNRFSALLQDLSGYSVSPIGHSSMDGGRFRWEPTAPSLLMDLFHPSGTAIDLEAPDQRVVHSDDIRCYFAVAILFYRADL